MRKGLEFGVILTKVYQANSRNLFSEPETTQPTIKEEEKGKTTFYVIQIIQSRCLNNSN